VRGTLVIQKVSAPQNFAVYNITGASTDNSGWTLLAVTYVTHAGSFSNTDPCVLIFARAGNRGADGTNGINPGLTFNFGNSTSMADPGNGDFRLNNAVLASVTAAAIDDLSAATGNPDVSAAVLSWDDSTNTANRGTLLIKDMAAPQNFAVYRITGASTDNAGWTQLALTHVSSAGSFTNGNPCSIEFSPAGAAGVSSIGKQTIWVPAAAMLPNGANPPLTMTVIAGSNVVVIQTRDCDATSEEYLYFTIAMPKSWDEGTLSFEVVWSHPATTTNFGVVFNLYANAFSNDDPLGQNAGTPGVVTDTGGTTDDLYVSPESSAFTVAGSPAEGDTVFFRHGCRSERTAPDHRSLRRDCAPSRSLPAECIAQQRLPCAPAFRSPVAQDCSSPCGASHHRYGSSSRASPPSPFSTTRF